MRTPCIKFIAETASFFIFLAMIVGNSLAERERLCDKSLLDNTAIQTHWAVHSANITAKFPGFRTDYIRNHVPDPMQMTLGLWICGKSLIPSNHIDGLEQG